MGIFLLNCGLEKYQPSCITRYNYIEGLLDVYSWNTLIFYLTRKSLTITSSLDGIEKTLSKKRKKRRERVMEPSRNMYRKTIEVLENWRIINHDTELSFINDFRINGRISQPDYEFMRNFHIDYKTFKCTKSRNHHRHENFGS